MRLIRNSGGDRVVDELRQSLGSHGTLDIATAGFSLFAFAEVQELLSRLSKCRLLAPDGQTTDLILLGGPSDRSYRNRLLGRWLAKQCEAWLEATVDVKTAPAGLPQATLIVGNGDGSPTRVISGNCPFTTEGLGITPGNQFSLIQATENAEECTILVVWFTGLWDSLPESPEPKRALLARLKALTDHREPALIYVLTLYHLFKELGDEFDEERIVKSATGSRTHDKVRRSSELRRLHQGLVN
ncbi:MAG: hypothetical protein GX575_12475 [Candidatus Anammoximicrobium sp.]|nr:hypothetical protein [Candidatus Anammoximicrobium sp.]